MKTDLKSIAMGVGIGLLMIAAYASVSDAPAAQSVAPTISTHTCDNILPVDPTEKVLLWIEQSPDGVMVLNWEGHQTISYNMASIKTSED